MRRQRILPLEWATVEMLGEFISRGGPVKKDDKHLLFGIGRGQAWGVVHEAARSLQLMIQAIGVRVTHTAHSPSFELQARTYDLEEAGTADQRSGRGHRAQYS